MLTLLYHSKEILQSVISGVPTSLPGGFNSRSLVMGIMGRWAGCIDLPVTTIAGAFDVTPQAVYGNIVRLQQLEAKIDALLLTRLLVTSLLRITVANRLSCVSFRGRPLC